MPSKSEKEGRKQIMLNLRKKADEEFEASLPMSRDKFKNLFDYLDLEMTEKSCDNTCRLTKTFLSQSGIQNMEQVLDWLADHGGGCDCEILANVEEGFE